MSRTDGKHFLNGVMLLLLLAMQLVAPLLHAHFGTPKLKGLHVHTALPTAVNSYLPSDHVNASAQVDARDASHITHAPNANGSEPLEVDIEDGIAPATFSMYAHPMAALVCLIAFVVLLAPRLAPTRARRYRRERTPPRWHGGSTPPPAHAPPSLS